VIVLDSSAAVDLLLYPRFHDAFFRIRGVEEMHVVPSLIGIEVASALRRKELAGELTPARAEQAMADFGMFQLMRFDAHELIWPAWRLRYNVTPYDASYVALADLFGLTLITQDKRLARVVAPMIDVHTLDD
jgi:predicted nucleic acid-binding protein